MTPNGALCEEDGSLLVEARTVAQVEVVDHLLWTKRVHGAPELRSKLEALEAGQTVMLKVAGEVGHWRKMSDNKTTGAPTPGLQPLGGSAAHWREIYRVSKSKGGALVDIQMIENWNGDVSDLSRPAERWEVAPPQERRAAWEAFKALRCAGWRSEAPYGPRDELYEREPK